MNLSAPAGSSPCCGNRPWSAAIAWSPITGVGYAGSGRVAGPVSIEQQAAQCQAGRITQPVLAVLGGDSHLVSPVWGERQALLAEALAGRFGRHPLTT